VLAVRVPGPLVVVKLGGSVLAGLSPSWWDDAAAVAAAAPTVFVHGWSGPLADWQRQRGMEPIFRTNQHGHVSRFTDHAVIQGIRIVARQLRELISRNLSERGVSARCVDAADEGLIEALVRPQRWWVDGELRRLDNLVGTITRVDTAVLAGALGGGQVPVVTPLARSAGHRYANVDADRATAAIAAQAGATELVMVTDVPGVLVDGVLVPVLRAAELPGLRGQFTGGMRKKVRAAAEAIGSGTGRAVIGCDTLTELRAGRAGTRVVA
jgi:acetylglutamate kinase